MAEIPVRRKEGRNVWPLLLGLIVLAAVLWFVVARRHPMNETSAARADSAAVIRADSAAAASGNVTKDSAGGALEKKRDTLTRKPR